MDDLLNLLNEITAQENAQIGPETELIMSGILDSMNVAELLAYLERTTGREIPISDLDLTKLSTPEAISANFLHHEGA